LLALHGHHDNADAGHLGAQDLGGFDTVHLGHIDVHEDDIGAQLPAHVYGFRATGRRTYDFDVTLEQQQLLKFSRVSAMSSTNQYPDFGIPAPAP